MKFEFDKKQIQEISKKFSYSATNVEKVIRLCCVLDDLNSLPPFEGKLLLKGGTAINLVAFQNLPRLSVDLDLDFAINVSKEDTLNYRQEINDALNVYACESGFQISDRSNYALDSKSLIYKTTTGSNDKIKLDINYHSRCHVYNPTETKIAFPFNASNKSIAIRHLSLVELFASKIKALYERCKPRDIFDVCTLAQSGLLESPQDRENLRKCIVFYSILGNPDNPGLLQKDLSEIRKMPFQALKTQLLPMLHTKIGHFDKDLFFDTAISYLEKLIMISDAEAEFLNRFYSGEFHPELIFDNETALNLMSHPGVIRTLALIKALPRE